MLISGSKLNNISSEIPPVSSFLKFWCNHRFPFGSQWLVQSWLSIIC